MQIDIFQVDAFATRGFTGNPAAVCPLKSWPSDQLMQQIAEANNLSETAFFVPNKSGFDLRWFTPSSEVDLCGHATLATAHVIFKHLAYQQQRIVFYTRSGELVVTKSEEGLAMDFPGSLPSAIDAPEALLAGLGVTPIAVSAAFDYLIELDSQTSLEQLKPNLRAWQALDLRGVVVTAKGQDCDFVSRCFFPKLAVDEDPVTGSAHCELAPYWAQKLGKNHLTAKQLSARSGAMQCQVQGDRVILIGQARDYMQGQINL
ncbi:PhzF family phenazine biosynthesis protein [Paraglaciecola aestuariivivens]